MTEFTPPVVHSSSPEGTVSPHRLELVEVELVGGGRTVRFHQGLNIIQGDITTGKTTFVRLLRGMLATFPDEIAPEVEYLSAIRGRVFLGARLWQIYRPRTTTRDALVEVSEEEPDSGREGVALRLPVASKGRSYSTFLLDQLNIPAVSVPQARTQPTGSLTAVSMSDWLAYCVITGDELDTQAFGHRHPFRDIKRKWVFELAYGYYDPDLARLNAELRSVELRIQSLEQESAIQEKFLAETPFRDITVLAQQLSDAQDAIRQVALRRAQLSLDSQEVPGVRAIRQVLLSTRRQQAELAERITRTQGQVKDLEDLRRQLASQSARMTRAIVADEWLVDFDFVVCPRCGSDIDAARTPPHLCYLCHQEPHQATSRDQLLAEQDRITSQIRETDELVASRRATLQGWARELAARYEDASRLGAQLDAQTAAFVSDMATQIEVQAAEQARLESNVARLEEYLVLLRRFESNADERAALEAQRDEVSAAINRRELGQVDAEANIRALEARMLSYLRDLHIPQLGDQLSVAINRTTYMPEVSGRTFDELSSQGLKTLVNIAHALAHHTVAIDRNLPLPGLLILDGLSANSGFEGFDQARVSDVYNLLTSVAVDYEGQLQIVAVDNELSRDIIMNLTDHIVLTLSQSNRLIRIPGS